MKNIGLVAVIPFLLLAVSCQSGGSPIAKFVPEKAMAVMVVESPSTMLDNSGKLVKTLGLDTMLGGSDMKTFIDKTLGSQGVPFTLDEFDLSQPAGLALVKGTSQGGKPGIVVFIGFKGGNTAFETFKAKTEKEFSGSGMWYQDGYVLIADGNSGFSGPFKETSKTFAAVSRGIKEGIFVWGDMDAFRTAFKAEYDNLRKEIMDELISSPGDTAEQAAEKEMTKEMAEAVLDVAEQLKTARFDLVLNDSGVFAKTSADFEKGKSVQGFLGKMAQGKEVSKELRYSPSDTMFAYAWESDPAVMVDMLKGMYTDALFSAFDMPSGYAGRFIAFMKESVSAIGPKGGGSFDFTLDSDKLSGFDPMDEKAPETLSEAIKIKMEMATDVKDVAAYKAFLKKAFSPGSPAAEMFDAISLKTGMKFAASVSEAKEGNFEYSKMTFGVSEDSARGASDTKAAAATRLLSAFPFLYAFSGKKVYMSMGAPSDLQTFAAKDGYADSLLKRTECISFLKAIPPHSQFVGYLNAAKIARAVMQAANMGAMTGSIPSTMPGMYGYGAVKDVAVEGGLFIPVEEIKGWASLASLAAMFLGGAF